MSDATKIPEERLYRIGRHELILPADHLLDYYQNHFRLYDRVLGDIAKIVSHKYPNGPAIDIGANIGDSAALLCRDQDLPVLCIEGSPRYLAFLRRNLDRLPPTITVAPYLVGPKDEMVPSDSLEEKEGTASLKAEHRSADRSLRVRPLADILADYPAFSKPRLIKSDTDGADFEILLSSLDLIRDEKPVLFFEYDPTFRTDGFDAGLQLIADLNNVGYEHFLVYDNFGYLIDIIIGDPISRFAHLNRYLMSHAMFGRQIYYLDVCACSKRDENVATLLYTHQNKVIDAAIANRRKSDLGRPA